jgi:hypothetical protein
MRTFVRQGLQFFLLLVLLMFSVMHMVRANQGTSDSVTGRFNLNINHSSLVCMYIYICLSFHAGI